MRCVDAADALEKGRMDQAAAYVLAAMAFDPANPEARALRGRLTEIFLARSDPGNVEADVSIAPIGFGFGVALGASAQMPRFLELLEARGDFETVIALCAHIERSDGVKPEERRAAETRRLAALAEIEARKRAEAEIERLSALGPSAQLSTEDLKRRLVRCFGRNGYRVTLADLREMRRREPTDSWPAYNLSLLLGSVAYPEVAEAVDLIVADTSDNPAELQASFTLLWSLGATRQALILADRLARYQPEFSALPPLHAMAIDTEATPAFALPRTRQARRVVYASLTCWGEKYIDLMERTCLASLLAPGNLPALAEKADVILEIYTMPGDLLRVRDSRILRRLAAFCEIRIYCFPEAAAVHRGPLIYYLLGMATHATLLRAAAHGGDLLFLYADVVLAQDCMTAIAQRLTDGPLGVFGDQLNLYASPMLARLETQRQDDALIVSRRDLLEAAGHCLAKRTTNTFYRRMDPRTPDHVCRVVFATERGLRTHGFVIAPLYFSHAAFAPFLHPDFGTQDGRIVEHVLDRLEERQIVVLSGGEYCAAELCDDDESARPIVTLGLEMALERFFTSYSISRRRRILFRHPIDYPGLIPPSEVLIDEGEVDGVVERILQLFETSPCLKDIGDEQDALRAHRYGARADSSEAAHCFGFPEQSA